MRLKIGHLFPKLEPCLTLDFPRMFPSLSVTAMPLMSSLCLIKGILMQLATATAVKGTHLFTTGGALCVSGQNASELYEPSLDNTVCAQFCKNTVQSILYDLEFHHSSRQHTITTKQSYIQGQYRDHQTDREMKVTEMQIGWIYLLLFTNMESNSASILKLSVQKLTKCNIQLHDKKIEGGESVQNLEMQHLVT